MTTKKPSPKIKVGKISSTHLPALTGIALLIGGVAIGFFMFGNVYESQLYTELISLIITIIVLDRINNWRLTHHATGQLKDRLQREAGSRSNEIATSAIDWMRHERWVFGSESLLNAATLRRANLERVYLKGASLVNAELQMANFYKAYLAHADLRRATLQRANLSYAYLMKTKLRYADLRRADLRHADLSGADLRGANLAEARLSHGTILDNIVVDAHCILPNGSPYEPGGKRIEEQFLSFPDEIVYDDDDSELRGIELDDVLQGRVSKLKARPESVIHSLMKKIHSLEDEELDELLEELEIIAHTENHIDDDILDMPLAFDGHIDEILDDVKDHEFTFLAHIEEELEDDASASDDEADKSAAFTDDAHEILEDLDDKSLNFLRTIREQLKSIPNPADSDERPTQPSLPSKQTSRLNRNDEQSYH